MKGLLDSNDYGELRDTINYLGIAAFVIDVEADGVFRVAAINDRHEQQTGMRHDLMAGRRIEEVLPADTAERVTANYRRCIEQRSAIDYQEELELPVGKTYWRTTLVPLMDASGRIFRLFGTAFEVSRSVHLELETRYQSTLLSAYLNESPEGILVVDAENNMKTWNQRFLEMWDIPAEVMEGRSGGEALEVARQRVEAPEDFIDRILSLYQNLDEKERGYRIRMRDGRILERYSQGLRDPEGRYWGRIWFYHDITEHELVTQALLRLSRTDPLTETLNRRAFMTALDEEFHRARRYKHDLTVMMLDLDHFKKVNDQYGHEGGDKALKVFAETVRPLLRDSDCLARLGGEEFAIMLPETDLAEGRKIAERVGKATARASIQCRRGVFGITVSIGLAGMQAGDSTTEDLLSRADKALYRAKTGGRDRVEQA
ncbi:diguanylate cyclase [Marinobacteraceae bacterium S3BR75-40.1]